MDKNCTFFTPVTMTYDPKNNRCLLRMPTHHHMKFKVSVITCGKILSLIFAPPVTLNHRPQKSIGSYTQANKSPYGI